MYLFESLNLLIQSYLIEDQIKLLRQAYLVARDAHEGQTRSSGEPYITHPVAVACILAEMHLDHETLMAALLHDIIEDTPSTYQDLERLFGKNVAKLVEGVSKLDKLKFRNKKEAQAENFRKMIMAMVQDIRVVLIKLADRIHNMRTLDALRLDKRRRIARETLEMYSPLAHRLGIHHLKIELEELGFKALYPKRYHTIKKVVKTARGNHMNMKMIQQILAEIEDRLTEAGISCRVSGREKHLYSIYCKMHLKEQRFHSIVDIYVFRVIVSDVDTCYRVLGQIHSLYKPRPGQVKDYIAIPKANGYQSLHTSTIGPHGIPIKIQIHTEDMDQMAEMGIAACWRYKEQDEIVTTVQIRAQRWIQSLIELQQSTGNSFEFIENIKYDLLPDEIYVFTQEGHIIELPAGATPIDFAYAVHTNIGHTCIGARVDRQSYPLFRSLRSGQTIEIITAPSAQPKAAWLNFVVSSKARVKIRQILKNLKCDNSVNFGCRLFNHTLYSNRRLFELPSKNIHCELNKRLVIINNLLVEIYPINTIGVAIAKNSQNNQSNFIPLTNSYIIPIKNDKDMPITFDRCCQLILGDLVVSYINSSQELVMYHKSCDNIRVYRRKPEKLMQVEPEIVGEQKLIDKIRVEGVDMFNQKSKLTNLSTLINITRFNIQSLDIKEKNGQIYSTFVCLTNPDRTPLSNIMQKIHIMLDIICINCNKNQK